MDNQDGKAEGKKIKKGLGDFEFADDYDSQEGNGKDVDFDQIMRDRKNSVLPKKDKDTGSIESGKSREKVWWVWKMFMCCY